jgi:hypothetical protein
MRAKERRGSLSTISFLMFMVISVIAFTMVMLWGVRYCKELDKSRPSFQGLVNKMNDLGSDELRMDDLYTLELKKGGGVTIFQKDVDWLYLTYSIPWAEESQGGDIHLATYRPNQCPSGVACLCYSKSLEMRQIDDSAKADYLRKMIIAVSGKEFGLFQKGTSVPICVNVSYPIYLHYFDCNDNVKTHCFKYDSGSEITEGALLLRDVTQPGGLFKKTQTVNNRFKVLYLEKYNGVIAIGFDKPSFLTESDKRFIDIDQGVVPALANCSQNYWCAETKDDVERALSHKDDKTIWSLTISTDDTSLYALLKNKLTQEEFNVRIPSKKLMIVKMNGDLPDWDLDEEVQTVVLRYDSKTDKEVTVASKGILVTIGNSATYNQMGPFPQVPPEGLPLYVFYKAKT